MARSTKAGLARPPTLRTPQPHLPAPAPSLPCPGMCAPDPFAPPNSNFQMCHCSKGGPQVGVGGPPHAAARCRPASGCASQPATSAPLPLLEVLRRRPANTVPRHNACLWHHHCPCPQASGKPVPTPENLSSYYTAYPAPISVLETVGAITTCLHAASGPPACPLAALSSNARWRGRRRPLLMHLSAV